ncbi:MAG: hypothetical protein ACTSV6_00210 [Candidatus Heimdallarchaeota archaeon]
MNKTITVQINFFGPYIKKEDIPKISNPNLRGTIYSHQRDLLQLFFELPFSALSPETLERYIEATPEELHTSVAPHTKEIFERLLKPLRSAKKNYCLGDYSATIASCGVVGEMLAILLWKINDTRFKGRPITEENEKGLFGSTFEKLSQARRLEILKTFGYINDDQYDNFLAIKDSRRPYLHLWSGGLKNERQGALDTLKKAFQLFKEVTGIGIADAGTVKINPLLLKLFENPKDQNKPQ